MRRSSLAWGLLLTVSFIGCDSSSRPQKATNPPLVAPPPVTPPVAPPVSPPGSPTTTVTPPSTATSSPTSAAPPATSPPATKLASASAEEVAKAISTTELSKEYWQNPEATRIKYLSGGTFAGTVVELDDHITQSDAWCFLQGIDNDRVLVKLPSPMSPVPERGDILVVYGTADQKHEPEGMAKFDFYPYLLITYAQLPKIQKWTGDIPKEWKVYRAADVFPRLVDEASRDKLKEELLFNTRQHHPETTTNGIKHREFVIPARPPIIVEGVPTVFLPRSGSAWIDDAQTNTRVSIGVSPRLYPNAFAVGKPARAVGYPDVGSSGGKFGLRIGNATPLP